MALSTSKTLLAFSVPLILLAFFVEISTPVPMPSPVAAPRPAPAPQPGHLVIPYYIRRKKERSLRAEKEALKRCRFDSMDPMCARLYGSRASGYTSGSSSPSLSRLGPWLLVSLTLMALK